MKRNKIYQKADPTREGKLYFIFCEGAKKEPTYFHFFNRLASQVVIQIIPHHDGKNSPLGLLQTAKQCLLKTELNPNPEYKLEDIDEVWFVIDTDTWGETIKELRSEITSIPNWYVCQSNPCFEVWLYYHFADSKPAMAVENWKAFLTTIVKGGFNNNKHPMLVQKAAANARAVFSAIGGQPVLSTTEVFQLAEKLSILVKDEIVELLKQSKDSDKDVHLG